MRATWVLVLAAAVAAAAWWAIDAFLLSHPAGPRPPAGESDSDRAAAVRTAFASPAPAGPVDPAVAAFFARLTDSANRRDGFTGKHLFDTARLYAAVRAADPAAPDDGLVPASRKFDDAAWDAFVGGWLGDGWTGARVKRVVALPGETDVVVYVRLDSQGGSVPARWWLTRQGTELRAYDVEDVRLGVRLSHQLAGAAKVGRDEATHAAVEAGLKGLAEAQRHLVSRDPARAEKALEPARTAPFPSAVRVTQALTEGAVALGIGRVEAALEWAKTADEVRPGIPGTDLLRAAAFYRRGEWAKAAERAGTFVAAVGPDTQGSLVLGRSLLELGERDRAAEVLRIAVAEFPDNRPLAEALRQAGP